MWGTDKGVQCRPSYTETSSNRQPQVKRPSEVPEYWWQKLKLFLCLINWASCHEDVWESGTIAPRILNSDIRWRWVGSSKPGSLHPGKSPGTHQLEGWVGSRDPLNAAVTRKSLCPAGNRTLVIKSLYRPSHLGSIGVDWRMILKCLLNK
jgi:hypothetical protein